PVPVSVVVSTECAQVCNPCSVQLSCELNNPRDRTIRGIIQEICDCRNYIAIQRVGRLLEPAEDPCFVRWADQEGPRLEHVQEVPRHDEQSIHVHQGFGPRAVFGESPSDGSDSTNGRPAVEITSGARMICNDAGNVLEVGRWGSCNQDLAARTSLEEF